MGAHNLYLKNSQVYDPNGDPYQGLLEAKAVMKITTETVSRLQQGDTDDVTGFNIEVTLILTAQNADLKYFIIDQITKGKTPVIPFIVGEQWDREQGDDEEGVKERVKLSNIRLLPEELELFSAKAEGNDKGQYEVKGKTNEKPVYLSKFPTYTE